MAMEEPWLGLLIVVSLLGLGRWLWARGVAWVLPRGRCRWPVGYHNARCGPCRLQQRRLVHPVMATSVVRSCNRRWGALAVRTAEQ